MFASCRPDENRVSFIAPCYVIVQGAAGIKLAGPLLDVFTKLWFCDCAKGQVAITAIDVPHGQA